MTLNRQPGTSERSPRRVVLLVEDEPFVLDATRCTLENAGFEVLPAADAEQALKLYQARRGRIDVLMTDMGLPGRNGQQLSQDVRNDSVEIPILFTSGYIENDYDGAPRQPKTYFLSKPYSRAELIASMEKIFRTPIRRRAASQAG